MKDRRLLKFASGGETKRIKEDPLFHESNMFMITIKRMCRMNQLKSGAV
jgi:hypothetical protein